MFVLFFGAGSLCVTKIVLELKSVDIADQRSACLLVREEVRRLGKLAFIIESIALEI